MPSPQIPTPPPRTIPLPTTHPPSLHQGEDWDGWFEAIPGTPNHNVNVAQGIKSAAVYARYNGSATYHNLVSSK